jgi:hypothetical protein
VERRPILIDMLDGSSPELESRYKYVKRVGNTIYAESFIPRLRGGQGAHLWAVAARLFDQEGRRSGAIEVVRDVTEQKRLNEAREAGIPWKKWGPYLSERQWGTVREDYSEDGNAWDYFTHDQARSRAYRWGEDGIAPGADNADVGTVDDDDDHKQCHNLINEFE